MTKDGEIVWEYVNPYWSQYMNMNKIYRAYRLPYEWIPQLETPEEIRIEPLDVKTFRIPGAAAPGVKDVTEVKGTLPFPTRPDVCIINAE